MNSEQKKQRRKELRARVRQRKLEKELELQKDQDLDEEELDVLETAEESVDDENVEKDMGVMAADPYQPEPGPTSFEELDAMKVAQEQADAVMEVTWQTRDLVRNILSSPMLDPVEKAEAMKSVADEFATRVTTEIEDVQKDLDFLELEAIIAHDRRSTSALEYFGDFIKKAVVTSSSRDNMPDSSFALTTTRDGKTVRKYLIHDKAHVRNALARAAQMIKQGGTAAADAKAALPKIHAAAKKMGIGSDMSKEHNAILIQKDATNQWRWVGWVSNNYIDWHNDIISKEAHVEYVEWWEKNKDLSPVFLSWHTPGTAREHPVDFMMYENNFLIASGILNEQEAAGLLKAQAKQDLGMSFQGFGIRDKTDARIIKQYRMYEVSDLPLDKAANPFTDFETLVKEVGMEPKDKLAYLSTIMGGEEKAKAFLEKTGMKKEALDAAGIESKEKAQAEPEPPAEPKTEETPVPVPAATAPTVEQIVEKVMKEMDIPGLNAFVTDAKSAMEKVPVLEGVIKEMQAGEEDKLAEKLTPPAARFAWSQENRPSNADNTLLKEGDEKDEKLKKETPGVPQEYWLSQATGTAPIAESK